MKTVEQARKSLYRLWANPWNESKTAKNTKDWDKIFNRRVDALLESVRKEEQQNNKRVVLAIPR